MWEKYSHQLLPSDQRYYRNLNFVKIEGIWSDFNPEPLNRGNSQTFTIDLDHDIVIVNAFRHIPLKDLPADVNLWPRLAYTERDIDGFYLSPPPIEPDPQLVSFYHSLCPTIVDHDIFISNSNRTRRELIYS